MGAFKFLLIKNGTFLMLGFPLEDFYCEAAAGKVNELALLMLNSKR